MCIVACVVLTIAASVAQSRESGAEPESDYKIGIEDVLLISVWGEPELNMSVSVRPDGKVTFPLVNDLRVAGRTPDEVRQEITKRISDFIREPNVTVIVSEIKSFKIYVLGEVASQGTFTFFRPTRLLQAIATAGGFSEFSKQQITVLRDRGSSETRIHVNVKKLVAGDISQDNFFLEPGDTLMVE